MFHRLCVRRNSRSPTWRRRKLPRRYWRRDRRATERRAVGANVPRLVRAIFGAVHRNAAIAGREPLQQRNAPAGMNAVHRIIKRFTLRRYRWHLFFGGHDHPSLHRHAAARPGHQRTSPGVSAPAQRAGGEWVQSLLHAARYDDTICCPGGHDRAGENGAL